MNTDRRESSITLYCIAEDKRSRSAQWKIIISETLVLTKIGVRILRITNNSYFLKTERNSVLHFPCAPIQPKHIFKCFFHLHYKLSNACPRFPRTKGLRTFSVMVLSNLFISCISWCTHLFWKELWQNILCNILMQILHEYYYNTAPSNMKNK